MIPLPVPYGVSGPQEDPGGAETGAERWDEARNGGTDRAAQLAAA